MKKSAIFRLIYPLFFACVGCISNVHAQVSYLFSEPVPVNGTTLQSIPAQFYGIYASDTLTYKYEITSEGIYFSNVNVQAISRETVRETSKYEVRNEHIFGVTEDSLPCILQGDYYYFGVRTRELLSGGTSENTLVKVDDQNYIINFKDDLGYTPMLLTFKGNELSIAYFTYDWNSNLFDKIQHQFEVETIDSNNMPVKMLSPTEKEFKKIAKKLFEPFAFKFYKS